MKQKTWIAVIILGTLAANAVAYRVVRSRRDSAPEATPDAITRTPTTPPLTTPPPTAPAEPPGEDPNEGLARARRAAGLAALEDRDYDAAVSDFTEALRLRKGDQGDLVELLRIAAELRTREQARQQGEQARAQREPTPAPTRSVQRTRPARGTARAQPRQESTSADETRGGLLLVTSTPPGLMVRVDGKPMDLTPARLPLRAGTYRVALAQGERTLAEETVELGEDDVRSLNRDLTAELALAPRPSATVPAPVESPPPAAPAATSPAATAARAESPPTAEPSVATAAPTATGKGRLDVTSPGLYGEVWINNRPYGFPPLVAQGLPAGPARLEVRVNGVVKRKLTVDVVADQSTAVRIR
ncbi:PEGA domain-containing protein [Myxococcus xanthus]|uniref:PEGA domain-containing protein n=1 Tax=Myxococcus xanthus TaxID=34 RepID=A0AAE6G611_MYXXA|nr:PEGA domain-containing protein [Myxococcus xanthus]QDE71385.1 PEGA domain-containing protein [Myxococcus xanthus]QDE78665.1 PEGA domain-containing protein [Myxococcus xanthus]QDE86035.1 PEGA domain-containing protein [Myxococcus xanthus]